MRTIAIGSQLQRIRTAGGALSVPAALTGLQALADDRQVTLRWDNPNNPGITGYEYWVREGAGDILHKWEEIPGGNAETTTFAVTGLTNGTKYRFRVRAKNGQNSSPKSATPSDPVIDALQFEGSGPYGLGDLIAPSVCFTGTVEVTGTPQLALQIGDATRQADYSSLITYESEGLLLTLIEFSYTVVAEDSDDDGISIGTDAISLNGGTIQGIGGTVPSLTIPASQVITNDASNKVDGGG